MKKIPLTQGQFAIVDDCDFERLNQWKWYAQWASRINSFYAVRVIPSGLTGKKRQIKIAMHRVILDAPKGQHTDHINHDTLDNRRDNLRLVDMSQNNCNRRKSKSGTSGFKGVSAERTTGKWKAAIKHHKRYHYLGTFVKPEDAAKAYDEAALSLHGEFASINFPEAVTQ